MSLPCLPMKRLGVVLLVLAGLVGPLGCALSPEAAGLFDSLVGPVNSAESGLSGDSSGAQPPGASDDSPGDDQGGQRSDGVSDDLPGDPQAGGGNGADDQPADDNGGARPAGASDDAPGDDHDGQRPDGVSDALPGEPHAGGGSGADDQPAPDNGAASNTGGTAGGGQELRLGAQLRGAGAQTGNVDYREDAGRRKFKVEVEHFAAGTYDVTVNGIVVGQIAVGALGTAELELDSAPEMGHTPLPANFPAHLVPGDEIGVGAIVSGRL